MVIDDKIKVIKKYLDKKKENKIIELIIKNYNNSNFYIALVYNEKTKKFKVAFIPLDIMETKKTDDYICYQFMNLMEVNYILQILKNSKKEYEDNSIRDKLNKRISNYYIEINININNEKYSFKATKYIPKEWLFMFDSLVIIFEYLPNIMGQLGNDILAVLTNSEEIIQYNTSVKFDLYNDDLDMLFSQRNAKWGKEYYETNQVKFLEKINGKYYAIVKDHIVILEYDKKSKTLSGYCDCSCHVHGKYIYAAILAIRNNNINKFTKIMLLSDKNDPTKSKYYLCYGLDNNNIKVLDKTEEKLLSIDLIRDGYIKIIEDNNNIIKLAHNN